MTEQNLNPDALHAAWESNNGYTEGIRMGDVERMVTAYLSALPAQPELKENSKPNQNLELQPDAVSSVEELEALPPCSVIVDKHGDAGLIEYGHVKFAETAKLPMSYVAKRYLPATVIYRPVEG